ncbi:MAG: hypothetical protein IIC69_03465 [Nanoarchaeota archaeon]|nr:hypothetical protein [Nanoarchaeota archaeon]
MKKKFKCYQCYPDDFCDENNTLCKEHQEEYEGFKKNWMPFIKGELK